MALYGESLALPPEMALAAGFTDARPDPGEQVDNPFIVDQSDSNPQGFDQVDIPPDYFRSEDNAVPTGVAGAMGVDARGDFRASSPNTLALQYGRNRNVNVTGGRIVSGGGGGAVASPAEGMASPSVFGQPSEMLTDPQFLNMYRQDPNAAKKHYEMNNPGHSLESDIKLQQAIEKSKVDFMKSAVGKLIENRLTFDPITGEATTSRMIPNPDPQTKFDQPFIESPNSKLTDTENALVHGFGGRIGGYQLLTGQKPPEGIPAPKGLTPDETLQFRQQVKETVKQDPRNITDEKKLRDAYLKTWNTNFSSQENAKAVAANADVAKANPSSKNLFRAVDDVARFGNLLTTAGNAPGRLIGDVGAPIASSYGLNSLGSWFDELSRSRPPQIARTGSGLFDFSVQQ